MAKDRDKDNQSGSRLIVGKYFADIVPDPYHAGARFHWVIQRFGSADVVHWGQEQTFEAAEKAAYEFMHEQLETNAKHTG